MFRRRKKKPSISSPLNFEHLHHAGFDLETGEFLGLPPQWKSIIENQNHDKRRSLSNVRELDISSQNSRCESIDPSNLNQNQLKELKHIVRGNQNNLDFTLNSLSSNSLNQIYPYGGSLISINYHAQPSNVSQNLSNSLNWINYPTGNGNLTQLLNSRNNLSSVSNSHLIHPLLPHQQNQLNSTILYSPIRNANQIRSPLSADQSLINKLGNLSLNNNQSINSSINRLVVNPNSQSIGLSTNQQFMNQSINSSNTPIVSSLNTLPKSTSISSSSEQKSTANQSQNTVTTNIVNKEYPEQFYRLSPFQKFLYANFLPQNIQQQFFELPYPQQQQILQAALEKQQQLQSPQQYHSQVKLKNQRQLQYFQERERERQLQLLLAQKQNQANASSAKSSINTPAANLLENIQKQNLSVEQLRFALKSIVDIDNPISKFDLIRKLADGSTAPIYLAKHKRNSTDQFGNDFVAIKKMNLIKQKRRELVFNEVAIMKMVNHPNIVQLISSNLVGNDECWIVMELCNGGILTDIITSAKMNENQIATLAKQCLSALDYLHRLRILHRDLYGVVPNQSRTKPKKI